MEARAVAGDRAPGERGAPAGFRRIGVTCPVARKCMDLVCQGGLVEAKSAWVCGVPGGREAIAASAITLRCDVTTCCALRGINANSEWISACSMALAGSLSWDIWFSYLPI